MTKIANRFEDLTAELAGGMPEYRTVVFIDDLDRCQGGYVVDLLEGIQTLFKRARVVFVVAADRRWLDACYRKAYEQFSEVCEPGKSLGWLFLEKAFQSSVPVPRIGPVDQGAYWTSITQPGVGRISREIPAAREIAEKVAEAQDEADLMWLVEQSGTDEERRVVREQAILRLESPEMEKRVECALQDYASLQEQSPRAMKRFVNSYAINRALAWCYQLSIDRNALALWTTLSNRWPDLADFLEVHPERIAEVKARTNLDSLVAAGMDEALARLCQRNDVNDVVNGAPTKAPLEKETVNECACLWM